MNVKRILTTAAVMGLLLVIAAGLSAAQEPEPGEASTQGALSLTSTVDSTISYQGMLTDDNDPVDGSRTMVFRLYSDSGCTTQVGSDINAGSVNVDDGYFDVDLPVDQDDFNGQALWLEVEVNGTDIGCEPIRPVPYALGLRPGAVISDSVRATYVGMNERRGSFPHVARDYGLAAEAWGAMDVGVLGEAHGTNGAGVKGLTDHEFAHGVYGSGPQFGVYGEATRTSNYAYGVYGKTQTSSGHGVSGHNLATTGNAIGVFGETSSPSGYAGYFKNDSGVALMAEGAGIIKSTADTEIAATPLNIVVLQSHENKVILRPGAGIIEVRPTSSDSVEVFVAVDVPTVLFGTPTKLKSARVCYKVDDAKDAISYTAVKSLGDVGSNTIQLLFTNDDKDNAWWTCYTMTADTPQQIEGSLFFDFWLDFAGSGPDHDIQIGKLTLTLTES